MPAGLLPGWHTPFSTNMNGKAALFQNEADLWPHADTFRVFPETATYHVACYDSGTMAGRSVVSGGAATRPFHGSSVPTRHLLPGRARQTHTINRVALGFTRNTT